MPVSIKAAAPGSDIKREVVLALLEAEGFNGEYFHDFAYSYPHIQSIDRHLPWTDPNCVRILDAVQPKYLTHELSCGPKRPQLSAVKRQLHTIQKGYAR